MKALLVSFLALSATAHAQAGFGIQDRVIYSVSIRLDLGNGPVAQACAKKICRLSGRKLTKDITDTTGACVYNQDIGIVVVELGSRELEEVRNLSCVESVEVPPAYEIHSR